MAAVVTIPSVLLVIWKEAFTPAVALWAWSIPLLVLRIEGQRKRALQMELLAFRMENDVRGTIAEARRNNTLAAKNLDIKQQAMNIICG